MTLRGAARLAGTLREGRALAELFRVLATLRVDTPDVLEDGVGEIAWRGPAPGLADMCRRLGAPEVLDRAGALARERGAA